MNPEAMFRALRELAEKWFAGELTDKRFAEMVAGLLNVGG